MADKTTPVLLQSSPHIASPIDSKMMMASVLIALAPVSIFAVIIFGFCALLNIIVAIVSAVAAESLFRLITKQEIRANDLSAGVSGLLLALTLPPNTPLWMTALGALFAVVVAKEFFGGLGANVFNPALIGRAFLVMSFPAALTTWKQPVLPLFASFTADTVTGATALGITNMGGNVADVGKSLAQYGLSLPDYWSTIKTLFFGFRAGSMGETSIFLILCAGLFLGITRVIDWRTPICMLASGFIFAFALGLDPVFSIVSGGFVFGAVFMATDYVTSPITAKGKIIFGIGAGFITMLIRKWGTLPEGTSFAILIMNAAVPFLNKLLPVKYGTQKKKTMAAKEAAK